MSNGWQNSGYSYDTCCRLGWADEMANRCGDEKQAIIRKKIADEVEDYARWCKEKEAEREAKKTSEG